MFHVFKGAAMIVIALVVVGVGIGVLLMRKIRMMMSRVGLVNYLSRVTLAMSILVNVLLGGHSYQTIAARNLQRMRDNKLNLVWLLDFMYGDCHSVKLWIDWRARR